MVINSNAEGINYFPCPPPLLGEEMHVWCGGVEWGGVGWGLCFFWRGGGGGALLYLARYEHNKKKGGPNTILINPFSSHLGTCAEWALQFLLLSTSRR